MMTDTALGRLEILYEKLGMINDRNEAYKKAIAAYNDEDSDIYHLEKIADLYIKLDDKNNALSFYKKLLTINPYNNKAREKLEELNK